MRATAGFEAHEPLLLVCKHAASQKKEDGHDAESGSGPDETTFEVYKGAELLWSCDAVPAACTHFAVMGGASSMAVGEAIMVIDGTRTEAAHAAVQAAVQAGGNVASSLKAWLEQDERSRLDALDVLHAPFHFGEARVVGYRRETERVQSEEGAPATPLPGAEFSFPQQWGVVAVVHPVGMVAHQTRVLALRPKHLRSDVLYAGMCTRSAKSTPYGQLRPGVQLQLCPSKYHVERTKLAWELRSATGGQFRSGFNVTGTLDSTFKLEPGKLLYLVCQSFRAESADTLSSKVDIDCMYPGYSAADRRRADGLQCVLLVYVNGQVQCKLDVPDMADYFFVRSESNLVQVDNEASRAAQAAADRGELSSFLNTPAAIAARRADEAPKVAEMLQENLDHLDDATFVELCGTTKADFRKLPLWKARQLCASATSDPRGVDEAAARRRKEIWEREVALMEKHLCLRTH